MRYLEICFEFNLAFIVRSSATCSLFVFLLIFLYYRPLHTDVNCITQDTFVNKSHPLYMLYVPPFVAILECLLMLAGSLAVTAALEITSVMMMMK